MGGCVRACVCVHMCHSGYDADRNSELFPSINSIDLCHHCQLSPC